MKVFIDTNVLIAAYVSHGACHDLYDHCLDRHVVYSSEFVRQELLEKLVTKIRLADDKAQWAYQHLCTHTVMATEARLSKRICRDADDDHVLAAAIGAEVECIISGDGDLLSLKKVYGIAITDI